MKVKKLSLPFTIKKPVLALGSQVKNTICYASGKVASITQAHNNLTVPGDLFNFEKAAAYFIKKGPKIIACDLHPDYISTKFAFSLGKEFKVIEVQHHHAHIASCMAENLLPNEPVIGVAFDGTGLGEDNTIWGAEFLICDYKKFVRRAHLKEIPLVGAERAILEPWRLIAAWFDFPKDLDKDGLLKKIYQAKINSPLASSMGRLFDAAASIILNKRKASFEAELAVELEKLADSSKPGMRGYNFKVVNEGDNLIFDPVTLLKDIVNDLKSGLPKKEVAWKFHFSVAQIIVKGCLFLRKEMKLNKVILSGGVFQNKVLLKLATTLLYKENFKVFMHRSLSCNDSCLSLGQAAIANYRG